MDYRFAKIIMCFVLRARRFMLPNNVQLACCRSVMLAFWNILHITLTLLYGYLLYGKNNMLHKRIMKVCLDESNPGVGPYVLCALDTDTDVVTIDGMASDAWIASNPGADSALIGLIRSMLLVNG
jgi:hypothetical protein